MDKFFCIDLVLARQPRTKLQSAIAENFFYAFDGHCDLIMAFLKRLKLWHDFFFDHSYVLAWSPQQAIEAAIPQDCCAFVNERNIVRDDDIGKQLFDWLCKIE